MSCLDPFLMILSTGTLITGHWIEGGHLIGGWLERFNCMLQITQYIYTAKHPILTGPSLSIRRTAYLHMILALSALSW